MTPQPPRPGAHGEGIPDASHEYVAEVGIDPAPANVGPITYRTVGVPSKLGRAMAEPMTDEEVDALGEQQSQSLQEFFDREARTVTVRIYYKGPGNPRAAVESALKQWSPKVFETEFFDA